MTAAVRLSNDAIEVEMLPAVGARLHRLRAHAAHGLRRLLTASKGALAWLPAGESLSVITMLDFRRTEEGES